jgi:PAS domain S-box-containing protein
VAIFDQKEDKEKVKNNEELYRIAFEITGDGFSIIQPIVDNNGKLCDYKYLYVNDKYERQTGLKAEAVVGKNAKQLFSKLEPRWCEMYDNFVRTGKPTWCENYIQLQNLV